MTWTISHFGNRGSISLPQLLFRDPDFFFHSIMNNTLDSRILGEANYILSRATSIKIPSNYGRDMAVHYRLSRVRRRDKFAGLSVIEKNLPNIPYPRSMIVLDVIDMYFPRGLCRYDKSGYKLMIRDIKFIYFGNRSYYMTRRRCEEFFDNDDNFV